MEKRIDHPHFLKRRRFLTMLPLLVLPFVTLLYWILVVQNLPGTKTSQAGRKGLDMTLPDAFWNEEKPMDKLSYYRKAAEDSLKRIEQLRNDPYRRDAFLSESDQADSSFLEGLDGPYKKNRQAGSYSGRSSANAGEAHVHNKIKELDKLLAQSTTADMGNHADSGLPATSSTTEGTSDNSADMESLQTLMSRLQDETGQNSQDPEMAELNGLLDKIMDVQHPERVADKIRKQSAARQQKGYPVTALPADDIFTRLSDSTDSDASLQPSPQGQNGFFSLDISVSAQSQQAIQATIYQTQTLTSGSMVKLRLVNDIYVGGVLVPKESFVFGKASLSGERLMVTIESVRLHNTLLPVSLSVYDLDGMEGIYIPGALGKDAARQSLDQQVQGLGIGTFDPSLGAQAASAGIQTAKTLLGSRSRLVQVTVKAGYQLLLHDTSISKM